MSSLSELLNQTRVQVRETDVDAVHAARRRGDDGGVLLDVRERDEYDNGHIRGALWIPRGLLELRIEAAVTDRGRPIVVYCEGDTRSVFAARTLAALGYRDVAAMTGGLSLWKQRGFEVDVVRTLTAAQRARYSRHLAIPELGEQGQRKLLDAKVLLLGVGGLGSPAALYLAAAGVGKLGLIDSDVVDASNLQRQIVHTDARVGVPKVDSATATLQALNPDVAIEGFNLRLTSANVLDVFSDYHLVIDGGDNFATRYLVNDACVHLGIPNVHGSVYRFEGQVTTFVPRAGPCYRCLYPQPPPPELAPNCQEAGVLGVLPGVIGVLQALEAIKLIAGVGEPLIGRLLCFDGLSGTFRTLRLRRDRDCALCGDTATWSGFADYEQLCSAAHA